MKIDNPFRYDTQMSMMRVCQFMCVGTAVIIAILIVVLNRDLASGAALITAILTPAFIGKAIQSFSEGNVNEK